MATDVLPLDAAASRAASSGFWRRIAGDAAWVSGSTLVGQVLGAATSLLLRILLDPAQIGLWQAVRLVVNYGNLSNLGVSRGATREMTIALGRGDEQAAQRAANVAFSVNTLASLVCGLLLMLAGLVLSLAKPASAAWGAALAVAGLLCILQRYVTYQVTALRARQAFALTARVTVIEATLTLCIGAGLTSMLGLAGLYFGSLIVGLLSAVYVAFTAPVALRLVWDKAETRRLLIIGFPILLAAGATLLFRSLDRLSILLLVPDCATQLGIYSVALLATGQLFGLANALATVMGPRYGEALGRHGTHESVASLAALASGPQTALLALIGGVAIVAGGPLLAVVLPAYREGLSCLAWLVPGTVALGIALPASQYLITVDRQALLVRIVFACASLGALTNFAVLRCGGGLVGLAAATGVVQGIYAVGTVALSFWRDLAPRERRRYLTLMCLPSAPPLATACLLAAPSGDAAHWGVVVFHSFLVACAWSCGAWAAWRLDLRFRRVEEDASTPTTTAEWQDRCYKPGALHLGNAMARHVTRPLALRLTRVLVPWGISANAVTGLAIAVACAAAGCFAWGTPAAAIIAALLLQIWYLLDHVDGQLARYHHTASLDGVQLDYLMHHLVNFVVPLGLGWGVYQATAQSLWMLAGVAAALGLLVQGLIHDARYKAFVQRLKWMRGELTVVGGGGFTPAADPVLPRRPARLAMMVLRKLCQMHVAMNVLGVLALACWLLGDASLALLQAYLAAVSVTAVALAVFDVVRANRRGDAEQEFARWFRLPDGAEFVIDDGWWDVRAGQRHAANDSPPPVTLLHRRKAS